jgi:hypothetical protein
MPAIWQAVVCAFQLEPQGQQFHKQTVAAAAAVLFGIARRNGIDPDLLPEMLRVLPPEYDAPYIYEALAAILQADGDAVAAVAGSDLIIALARTFGLKESALADLAIAADVAGALLEVIRQLAIQPGAQGIIHSALPNEAAQERPAARATSQ